MLAKTNQGFDGSINALQRTAAGRRGCNRRVTWPPSLGILGRSAKVA